MFATINLNTYGKEKQTSFYRGSGTSKLHVGNLQSIYNRSVNMRDLSSCVMLQ